MKVFCCESIAKNVVDFFAASGDFLFVAACFSVNY